MATLRTGVLTCSDTRGESDDTAGAALRRMCEDRGWEVAAYRICPDDRDCVAGVLREWADDLGLDVVFTCGSTGLGPRDIAPEATEDVCEREAPGIAEAIRSMSLAVTGRAMLSRGRAGTRGGTLIINLPGSEKGAVESFGFVADQLEHAVEMMAGGGH